MDLLGFLLRKKPALTLIKLRDRRTRWYPSLLAKEVDCTYPHMIRIISALEKEGLVRTKKEGRTKYVELTEKGDELAHDLEGLVKHILRLSSGS